MKTHDLDLTADYIDVRDVIARYEELESERQNWVDVAADAKETYESSKSADDLQGLADEMDRTEQSVKDWDEDEGQEFAQLTALLEDLKGNGGDEQWRGDWYPVTLIRDSYFETAMDDLLEDIGELPKDLPCYLKITVDYDALQMDYTSTEIDSETYWYR
jgi:hypothetical protein